MRLSRLRSMLLAMTVLAAGCATASPGTDGGVHGQPDAKPFGRPDARPEPDAAPGTPDAFIPPPDAFVPVPDAMSGTQSLTQSTSGAITNNNSIGCYQAENSYYRAYTLSDYGISTPFQVTKVDFGVELAQAGTGTTQPVTINLYSYTGATGGATLDTASMTKIGTTSLNLSDVNTTDLAGNEIGSGKVVSANVTGTVPAGGTLVAEVYVPDATASGDIFFMGSNTGGESKPGYIRAPTCSTTNPTSFASLKAAGSITATVDIVLNVTGTY